MFTSKSRVAATIIAAGASCAAFAMIQASTAAADPATIDCEPGQVVIDGQCNLPPVDNAPAPQAGDDVVHAPDPGMAGGVPVDPGHPR